MAKSIKSALSTATCILLAPMVSDDAQSSENSNWQIDASVMLYTEKDRVTVNEDVLSVKKEISDEEFVTANFIVDVMSGPSPNGAPISSQLQTMTTPSGRQAVINPQTTPSYDFEDTRYATIWQWVKPVSRLVRSTNAFSISSEYDYLSRGISSEWEYDINYRLSTLSAGAAITQDTVNPVGGIPSELDLVTAEKNDSKKDKLSVDWMLGYSQILSRNAYYQLNYTLGYSEGYLTDPYKVIAVVDDVSLEPAIADSYFNEKRPADRTSHALYFKYVRNIKNHVMRLSYRYFSDSWNIKAHTVDLKYAVPIASNDDLQFHFRFYDQTAASFYHYYLVDETDDPSIAQVDVINENLSLLNSLKGYIDYASADYRLGNLNTYTVGFMYSRKFDLYNGKLKFRLDHIQQKDKKNKFSDLNAWLFQIVLNISI